MKTVDTYHKILVFDVETTGLDYNQDEIIDFGAVLCENHDGTCKPIKEVNVLVKASRPISPEITDITGITQTMSDGGVTQKSLAKTVRELLEEKPLVIAYNLQFDLSFVSALMARHERDYRFDCDVLDMMTAYKDLYEYPHRLENALERFDLINVSAHRAQADAVATLALLEKMHAVHDVNVYINCIGYHSRYGLRGPTFNHVRYLPQTFQVGRLRDFLNRDE